jgi:hypothetical protein
MSSCRMNDLFFFGAPLLNRLEMWRVRFLSGWGGPGFWFRYLPPRPFRISEDGSWMDGWISTGWTDGPGRSPRRMERRARTHAAVDREKPKRRHHHLVVQGRRRRERAVQALGAGPGWLPRPCMVAWLGRRDETRRDETARPWPPTRARARLRGVCSQGQGREESSRVPPCFTLYW